MWLAESPWQLPSTHRFLEQVVARRGEGGAWVRVDSACPEGLVGALDDALRASGPGVIVRTLENGQQGPPVAAIAGALDAGVAELGALVNDSTLADHVVVVNLREAGPEDLAAWERFFRRLAGAIGDMPYWAVVAIAASDCASPGLAGIDGRDLIKPLDSRVWAGLRLPPDREPPVDLLAEALAVELGGSDLDFIATIVGARYDELLDPKRFLLDAWKERLEARGGSFVLASFELAAWRAQLQALFPWLETLRRAVIFRYGKRLVVDESQARLGISTVDQIELGAIFFQLAGKVPVHERDYLRSLVNVRNSLAHRRLADARDLNTAIRSARKYTEYWLTPSHR